MLDSKRREFIALLGGLLLAAKVRRARGQQQAMPVIGFLGSESPDVWANYVRAFQQGLRETGYVEGHNVAIEYRWAEGRKDRLPALVTELVYFPAQNCALGIVGQLKAVRQCPPE